MGRTIAACSQAERQKRSRCKGREMHQGFRCLVNAFEASTHTLYVHYRDHALHKEHDLNSPVSNDPKVSLLRPHGRPVQCHPIAMLRRFALGLRQRGS